MPDLIIIVTALNASLKIKSRTVSGTTTAGGSFILNETFSSPIVILAAFANEYRVTTWKSVSNEWLFTVWDVVGADTHFQVIGSTSVTITFYYMEL